MPEYRDGALWPLDKAGIGIELIHEEVDRYAVPSSQGRMTTY